MDDNGSGMSLLVVLAYASGGGSRCWGSGPVAVAVEAAVVVGGSAIVLILLFACGIVVVVVIAKRALGKFGRGSCSSRHWWM